MSHSTATMTLQLGGAKTLQLVVTTNTLQRKKAETGPLAEASVPHCVVLPAIGRAYSNQHNNAVTLPGVYPSAGYSIFPTVHAFPGHLA